MRLLGITVSARAIILPSSPPHVRRGTIRYMGPVPTIPFPGFKMKVDTAELSGPLPLWLGIELDEAVGGEPRHVAGDPPRAGVGRQVQGPCQRHRRRRVADVEGLARARFVGRVSRRGRSVGLAVPPVRAQSGRWTHPRVQRGRPIFRRSRRVGGG